MIKKEIIEKNLNDYHIIYRLIIDNNINNIEVGACECNWLFGNAITLRNKNVFMDASVFIKGLHVHPQYRNQGYGSKLLKKVIEDARQNNIFLIELDDMSDHFAKSNNIYLKNGFRYENVNDGPEMYLNI